MIQSMAIGSMLTKILMACFLICCTLTADWVTPDNLYKVVDEKLEKFEPTPENFIVTTEIYGDQKRFKFLFTLPEVTMLVSKSEKNKIPHKLENGDGAIIVGPDFEYLMGVGSTPTSDDLADDAGFMDVYEHLKERGMHLNLNGKLNMQPYEMEAWPTKMLLKAVDSHQQLMTALNENFWNQTPNKFLGNTQFGKYIGDGNNQIDLEKEYIKKIRSQIEHVLARNFNSIIKPKRQERYDGLVGIAQNKYVHTEYWEVKYECNKKVKDTFNDLSFPKFNDYFWDLFANHIYKSIHLDTLYKFLQNLVVGDNHRKNLILRVANESLKNVNPGEYKGFSFTAHRYNFDNLYAVGADMIKYFTDHFKAATDVIVDRLYTNYTPRKAKEKSLDEYAEGLVQEIKRRSKAAIENMNENLLIKEYKVEFTADEIEKMVEDIAKSAYVLEFLGSMFDQEVYNRVYQFVRKYMFVASQYSLIGDIIIHKDAGYWQEKNLEALYMYYERFVMLAKLTGTAHRLSESETAPFLFFK